MKLLAGLRIVEGSAFVAAPLCGMTLAQLGAEVIRFDQIGGGLDYRRWPVNADNNSIYWAELNKGKRSIAVDLKSQAGRELVTELICAPGENAGIFSTNLPARGWLAYETLCEKRPDLIAHEIVGDRHGGIALDYTVNAKVGFPFITGPESLEGPVNHVLPAWDIATAYLAAIGILAAERHRRMSGQGQRIELALEDVALTTVGNLGLLGEVHVNDEQRARHGNDLYGAIGRDFVTADGKRLMVLAITAKQWRALLQASGLQASMEALANRLNLDFNSEGDRFRARREICDLLQQWMASESFAPLADRFDRLGVCWEKYQSIRELASEDVDASEDNPIFSLIDQPGLGAYPVSGPPMHFSGVPRTPPDPAPTLGQHTEQILAEVLHLDGSVIAKLHDDGVVA